MVPTPMDLATDPDFELATAIMSGGDWTDNSSEWSNAINPECKDLGGPDADYRGGGFVTGPDGLPYAIVVPWVQDGESQHTADVGPANPDENRDTANGSVGSEEPCVGNLNGGDQGWTPVGYQSGIERFQEAPTPIDRMFGAIRRHHRHGDPDAAIQPDAVHPDATRLSAIPRGVIARRATATRLGISERGGHRRGRAGRSGTDRRNGAGG